jgi:hypothetical protein
MHSSIDISGIQCDTPGCDYRDMEVLFEDYPKWVNKPCPKCGANLLTQECYDECVAMVQTVEIINEYSVEYIEKITKNMSPEEIDNALDLINRLKLKKKTDGTADGMEVWTTAPDQA